MSSMYFRGILSQLEKQFDLDSSTLGLIDTAPRWTAVVVGLVVSSRGHSLHRPRYLAFSSLLMTAGPLLMTLPQFLSDPQITTSSSQTSTSNVTSSSSFASSSSSSTSASQYWYILLLAQLLYGIGVGPMYSLVISYLDDGARSQVDTEYGRKHGYPSRLRVGRTLVAPPDFAEMSLCDLFIE